VYIYTEAKLGAPSSQRVHADGHGQIKSLVTWWVYPVQQNGVCDKSLHICLGVGGIREGIIQSFKSITRSQEMKCHAHHSFIRAWDVCAVASQAAWCTRRSSSAIMLLPFTWLYWFLAEGSYGARKFWYQRNEYWPKIIGESCSDSSFI